MAEKEGLTKNQVYDVLKFSNALYGYMQNGVWSPSSQNDILLRLNNNQKEASYKDVVEALSKSLENADEIQGYSEFMSIFDTIYSKTIRYYSKILAFDLHWNCINASGSDYTSKEYKDDEKRLMKFLDNFDYKREFQNKVLPQLLKTGIYYGWFRDSSGTITDDPLDIDVKRTSKYTIQTMPQKKCKITNNSNAGYLYDFDMNYFLQPSVDIQTYDPSLIKKFKNVFADKNTINYKPHNKMNNRDGVYTTYVQTSIEDGAMLFKWDESNANVLPPFANLMKASFNNTKMHELQMDKNMASAWAILYGNIGLLDSEKSGQKPNQTAFTPEVMGDFMRYVQASLKSIMKTVALPLEDTRFGQFQDSNADMESNGLVTSATQGAFGSPLIFDNSTSKGQALILNGLIADYNEMKSLYYQFAYYLGYFCNKKTRKYKFAFTFDGSNFPFEREYRTKQINELADRGITLPPQYWASAYGFKPQDFKRALEEAHNCGMNENYITPLINMATVDSTALLNGGTPSDSSVPSDKGGRPKSSEGEISDAGASNHDYA